jgi:5S rRNA maturation endonuclease (ribonuclease M5)
MNELPTQRKLRESRQAGKQSAKPLPNRAAIITAHPIVEFVRERGHKLKERGENFETNACPVTQHNKSGHMPVTIYPATQSWTCHDCKRGGSVIDWLVLEKGIGVGKAMRELSGDESDSRLVAVYGYTDENGQLKHQTCRFEPGKNGAKKDFKQRRPDGKGGYIWNLQGVRCELYWLPEVIKAQLVIIVEGEKDADNVRELGFTATTNPMGAGKWRDEYSETLLGKDVVVFGDIGDPDQKGERHTRTVLQSLNGKVRSLKHAIQPDGFHDVSDWIATLPKGEARQAVEKLIEDTPLFDEAAQTPDDGANAIDDDAEIKRLSTLSTLEYERQREEAAKKLRCRESVLDRLVNAERLLSNPAADGLQGETVSFPEIEPWPERVSGPEVLNQIAARFTHYVYFPTGVAAADASALWAASTHCYHVFDHAPLLHYSSPEKRSGKTITLEVLGQFVPRALSVDNVSTAALFRVTAKFHPILLGDECDTWLPDNDELRGLFNSGYRRTKKFLRCVGDNQEPRLFDCFTPKALSGLGSLPGTMLDRSIGIRLARAKKEELKARARFDQRHLKTEIALCRKLARFVADNLSRLENCDPKLPENVYSRDADKWRPLFAIAEVAGGNWPERCAQAYAKLQREEFEDRETLRVMLLADIREIFKEERMFSKDLVAALADLKERPWPEVNRGKPITARWLARNLVAFGIRPKNVRIKEEFVEEEEQGKGYERTDFDDAYTRYLPTPPK